MKNLGKDILEYLMGVKLNNMEQPKTLIENDRVIRLGREWINSHPGEHINIY